MELRNSVRQAVDEFLKRGDLAALFKWVNANKAAVYQSRDDDARELVDKARATIDAVLKGHIQPPEARGIWSGPSDVIEVMGPTTSGGHRAGSPETGAGRPDDASDQAGVDRTSPWRVTGQDVAAAPHRPPA